MKQAFPAGRVFNVTFKRPKPKRRKGTSPAALLTHSHRRLGKPHPMLRLMRLLRVAPQDVVSRSPARHDPHHIRGYRHVDLAKQRRAGRHGWRGHGDAAQRQLSAPFSLSRRGRAVHETSHIVSTERGRRGDSGGATSIRPSSRSGIGHISGKRLFPSPRRDPWRAGLAHMGGHAARHSAPRPAHAAKPAFRGSSRQAGLNGNADLFPSDGTFPSRRHAFVTRRASRHARATHFPRRRNIAAASLRQFSDRVFTGGKETGIAAHRFAGRGLPYTMRHRRAPRPGHGRLQAHEVTATFGPPTQRRAKQRAGVERFDPFRISARGRTPSSRADRGTRENRLSDRVRNRAFRPLRRDATVRASRYDETLSPRRPHMRPPPSKRTETGHGTRSENSAPGPMLHGCLALGQARRGQHDRGRGEGKGRPLRRGEANFTCAAMSLSEPERSISEGRQMTDERIGAGHDIRTSAAVRNVRRNAPSDDKGASWRSFLQNAPQFAMAPTRQNFETRQAVERDPGRMVTRRDNGPDDSRADPATPGGPDIFTSPFSQETLLAGQANIGLM
ncbi:hypothetical protein CGLAMM_10755 [Acetobacteraceae bacterium EV16G]|uniref:Uncharacterized protein n=2 Tax=Sorlinia euscelidii TaxID=3081148 RepID=A0ABU7U082_9PROT